MNTYTFLRNYIERLSINNQTNFILNDGVVWSEVEMNSENIGGRIPSELIEFYEFSYGAKLDEYLIFTLPEIALSINKQQATYGKLWNESLLPFGYLMGVGDLIVFDLEHQQDGVYLIRDGFHESPPTEWNTICYGLNNWLVKMVENDFHPFWL